MKHEVRTRENDPAARKAIGFAFCFLLIAFWVQGDTLPTTTVIVNPQVRLEVELAYNNETRASGLMFRKSLPEDGGMLFLFTDLDYHSFWMKNTLIPLDLIWLNERMEIVYFLTAEPCRKDPCSSLPSFQKAQYVLEVNAGFVKKHRLQVGNKIEFTLPPGLQIE